MVKTMSCTDNRNVVCQYIEGVSDDLTSVPLDISCPLPCEDLPGTQLAAKSSHDYNAGQTYTYRRAVR